MLWFTNIGETDYIFNNLSSPYYFHHVIFRKFGQDRLEFTKLVVWWTFQF
jgi:hypothetical protein